MSPGEDSVEGMSVAPGSVGGGVFVGGRGVRVGRGVSVAAGVSVMTICVCVGVPLLGRVAPAVGVSVGNAVSVGVGRRTVGRGVGVRVLRANAMSNGACPLLGSTISAAIAILGTSTPIPADADDAMTAL